MRSTAVKWGAVVALAALTLTGCAAGGGSGGGNDRFKVVAFTAGNQTPIGAWWVKAVQKVAKDNDWDLTMVQGDFDYQKMNPQVESAIGQGADAVFDGYTDQESIGSIISAAKDADIPIFAMDSATAKSDNFALNVTTNQQQIVDKTLDALSKSIGGLKGKTVMVIGHDPHPGIRLRAALAAKALQAAGATVANGDVQKVQSPATGRTEALKMVQDYLSAHPNGLDGVWVGWDDAAMGAAQAVTEANSKAKVTGSDAISEAVSAIQSGGPFLATADQPWPDVLKTVSDDMVTYQKTKKLPKTTFDAVDCLLVTKDNASTVTPSDKLG